MAIFESNFDWKDTFYYYLWRFQNAMDKAMAYIQDGYARLKFELFLGYVPHCVYYFKEAGKIYTFCNHDNMFSIAKLCFSKYIMGHPLNLVTLEDIKNISLMGCPTIVLYKTYDRVHTSEPVYETYYAYDQASDKTHSLKIDNHGVVHHMKRPKPIAFVTSRVCPSKTEDISSEYASVGILLSNLGNVTAKEFLNIAKEFYGNTPPLQNMNLHKDFSAFTMNVITVSNDLHVYKEEDTI